jgi:hypothetical protein
MLGYRVLPNGARVSENTTVNTKLGRGFSEYQDEWSADYERLIDKAEAEASARESSEDTEVRETVLSEDVHEMEIAVEETPFIFPVEDQLASESDGDVCDPEGTDE